MAEASNRTEAGEAIVVRARQWIGTPYRHQSSCRGAGADCLGLLRGLWRETLGEEPQEIPPYTADWAEFGGGEDLLAAARRHLLMVARPNAQGGDVLILRMKDEGVAKHVGILAYSEAGHATMIHAYSGYGVVESPLTPAWARRIVEVFRFPEERS
ncbi:NlpC/P60 family protein [uncultured Amaricoccus sp.]|uniref:NlpC/P60 family protein n=1 Tax=uncultured Amaricoccus sp. TaxID=339341 RepID=UPI0026299AA9|nr:NlpC/P60 family protein [uncultured Amaricoccus sp.]